MLQSKEILWIYCFENKFNGKKYIGKTNNFKVRLKANSKEKKGYVGLPLLLKNMVLKILI